MYYKAPFISKKWPHNYLFEDQIKRNVFFPHHKNPQKAIWIT